jgi:hypothetical protein
MRGGDKGGLCCGMLVLNFLNIAAFEANHGVIAALVSHASSVSSAAAERTTFLCN